jgi:hypothetical protein
VYFIVAKIVFSQQLFTFANLKVWTQTTAGYFPPSDRNKPRKKVPKKERTKIEKGTRTD